MKAFISYSHKDEWALARLKTHLAVLRREGKIETWADQQIMPGDTIDDEVVKQLNTCDLFIPLVSPDFLDSFYCYEKELAKAVERQNLGTMRIVPVVIEPCDWKGSPLRQFKALPKDGKPVTEYTNSNLAFLEITTGLRVICETNASNATQHDGVSREKANVGAARRYKAKRSFDVVDRQKFLEDAFQEVRTYIDASISELNEIDGFKAHFSLLNPNGFSCTILNKARQQGTASLTAYMRSGRTALGDIYWSNEANARPNTANGWFSIDHDDYEQYLTLQHSTTDQTQRFTPKQAAEHLWEQLIEKAGISYD